MTERTYTGWKAGLLVVFAVAVAVAVANLAFHSTRDDPRRPDKVVTTVTPTR